MTHFTSDSTLPFWLPAPSQHAFGMEVEFGRQLQQRGMPDRLLLGVTPAVTVFMLSKTSTQGTQPSARTQSTNAEQRLLAHLRVKRTQVQRLYSVDTPGSSASRAPAG